MHQIVSNLYQTALNCMNLHQFVSICIILHQIRINLHQYASNCINFVSICINMHQICINFVSICINVLQFASMCINFASICINMHQIRRYHDHGIWKWVSCRTANMAFISCIIGSMACKVRTMPIAMLAFMLTLMSLTKYQWYHEHMHHIMYHYICKVTVCMPQQYNQRHRYNGQFHHRSQPGWILSFIQ